MKRPWHRLPTSVRVAVIVALCALSVRPLFGWASQLALWLVLTLLFWGLGAFRLFRLVNVAYLSIVSLTLLYVILYLAIRHQPLSDAAEFAMNYPQFLMFMLAALIIASGGVLLEEWISVADRIPLVGHALSAIVISISAGFGSLGFILRRANESRRSSNPRGWAGLNTNTFARFGYEFLDRIELLYTTTEFMRGLLAPDINKWWRFRLKTQDSGELRTMRLDDIYEVDSFPQIYESVFAEKPISPEWLSVIEQYLAVTPNPRVLEIGSGSGRLSFHLASLNVTVDAIESNPFFVQIFRQRLEGNGSHPVRIFHARFPETDHKGRYDLVILHQNVMLELVNEMKLQVLWEALKAATADNGVVIFDYPTRFRFPDYGQRQALLNSSVPQVGQVQYSYTYNGLSDGHHRARIYLETKGHDEIVKSHEFTLIGIAPEEVAILGEAKSAGFSFENRSKTEAFTFFPSELQIYVMRLNEGA